MSLEIVTNIPLDENDLLAFGIDELARMGAKRLLNQALQLEVEEYVSQFKHLRDPDGDRLVVRNGKGKARNITTGSGTLKMRAPRVNDRRKDEKFTSKILPPYLRKSRNVESILPLLYLKGLSGNAFQDALSELLGEDAAGLSSSSISALKKGWAKEHNEWKKRDILEEFIYLWCDGVYLPVRLGSDKKTCLLVVMGVNQKGEKKLLAVEGGFRESKESWKTIFSDLESRGLKSPLMIIGDGGLGLWAATGDLELFKNTKEQRCWFHKIQNVLNCLPKKLHNQAKNLLNEMMKAPSKSEANRQLSIFKSAFADKYEKAYDCLNKDWKKLTNFFDFPATQWIALRTTNPIESIFATVKLRTNSTRGAGSIDAAESMTFKLLKECEKRWKRIRGWREIEKQLVGGLYKDGILVESSVNQEGVA